MANGQGPCKHCLPKETFQITNNIFKRRIKVVIFHSERVTLKRVNNRNQKSNYPFTRSK